MIMAVCIVIAFLSDNMIVKCLGIISSILTCISSFLTEKEFKALQKKSENALYAGDSVDDNAPEVGIELFK